MLRKQHLVADRLVDSVMTVVLAEEPGKASFANA